MSEYGLWWRKTDRLEHRQPIDGVEYEDVLADQVDGSGPKTCEGLVVGLETCRSQVVDEGVEPDVGDIARVEWQPDTPV